MKPRGLFLLVWPLLLLLLLPTVLGETLDDFFVRPSSPVCHACLVPHPTAIHWIPYARPPCFHPGQPIFIWPTANTSLPIEERCRSPSAYHSAQVSVDEDGLVFARERLCFYDTIQVVEYSYVCAGTTLHGQFRLGHILFSKRRREKRDISPVTSRRTKRSVEKREKRWSRRRNPHQGAIHFQQQSYVKELAEDAPVDTVVVTVSATHAAGHPLYYSMAAPQDGRSQNIYTLDTHTGEIRLAKALDRETLDRHVLKVTAFERLDPSISSSASVVVEVLDVQDNSPQFERDSYFAEISEDAPIGTTIVSVFARDRDAGANGEVEYSLETEAEGSTLLSINPNSGVIQTAAALDRETLSLIRLYVIASDKGKEPLSSRALVELSINDVNDNAPVFSQDSYNITVLENVTVPVVIARLEATDADAGANGRVHYGMVTSSDLLHVDYKTGEVTLRRKIDARGGIRTFVVRAKDGAQPALSSTATLTLQVVDINDHPPRFIAAQKSVLVDEGVAEGEEVARVYAIDEDAGVNGKVSYSLEGSADFRIDPDSGIIRANKTLDREETQRYELTVRAVDGGEPQLTAVTQMTILVRDINDNTPVFKPNEMNVTLSEETQLGAQIAIVRAEDRDENSKLFYRIEHQDREGLVALIDLGEQGALLSLSSPLQPSVHSFRFVVSATDDGGLKGNCSINIYVTDVNSPPRFPPQPFSVRIPEDATVGQQVMVIRAEDTDRGDNAQITYSIDSPLFRIDNATGEITVAAELDREEQSSHSLTVTATDAASPPLSSSTSIEVILDDVNDNVPEFSSLNYTATVSEDIAVGTSFIQILATDVDAGPNGIVDYFLNTSGPGADLFRLDRTSGTLRVNQKLDREKMAMMTLPVYAEDRGQPPLRAHSMITVMLMDVNDNAPQFSQPSYDLWIAENQPAGTLVGTLVATDPDEGSNADIEFRVFGGTDARLFELEADPQQKGVARLLSRQPFDYESKTNAFNLEVQASSGQLSSTVPVRVHVSDVNDHPPSLRPSILLVNRMAGGQGLERLGSLPAFDPDQNATLEYSVETNELLAVDRYSGKITLKGAWKRNIDAQVKACVSDGANTVCNPLRLLYTWVEDSWLGEAVTVSLRTTTVDDFLDPDVYARFRQSLASLSTWAEGSITVLSILAKNSSTEVSFVVVDRTRLISGNRVAELIAGSLPRLSELSLLDIELASSDACLREPCPYYQKCRDTLKHLGAEFHQTDNFLAHSLKTLRTFTCECPRGFSSSPEMPESCNIRLDECFSGPCQHNGSCKALEDGFRCDCQPGWMGKSCELSTRVETCLPGYCREGSTCELTTEKSMKCTKCRHNERDTDERCRLRSLHFGGHSLLRLPRNLPRIEWTVQLSFSTITRSGTLLFAGEKGRDFVELKLDDRILTAEISLGGESKTVRLREDKDNRVNDGHWHMATLAYLDRTLTLTLDDCDPAVAKLAVGAPGCAARATIDLPAKCLDATVPCHRFFDSSAGLSLAGPRLKEPRVKNGFHGCLANLTIDGELVDFSNLDQLEKIGHIDEGCSPKRDFCADANCGHGAHCVNRWLGFNCRCPHAHHQGGDCLQDKGRLRQMTLAEEESFVLWKVPSGSAIPLEVSLEFRTLRDDTQVFVIEFDEKNLFYRMELENGLLKSTIGQNTTFITCPDAARGHWTKVELELKPDEVTTIIDGIYTATQPLSGRGLSISSLYSGIAPSTSHPARFDGCIREAQMNGLPLKTKNTGKIRQGCVSTRGCQAGSCPENSMCRSFWDGHRCDCDPGYAGAACDPICSLEGICGPSGICVQTNSTIGYECHCANGRLGVNCESLGAVRTCPSAWWGRFGECRRCDCPSAKGFAAQCHPHTGQCLCPREWWESGGRCVRCECGLGATSLECDPENGQCSCAGEAAGRRCDRCPVETQVLDPKSLRCLSLRDRCPSQIDEAVQWPTTVRGATARQSCANGQIGLATRKCGETGKWQPVQDDNCTRAEFSNLLTRASSLSAAELVATVWNASQSDQAEEWKGRNLEMARIGIGRALDMETAGESDADGGPSAHLYDHQFVHRLVEAAGQLLPNESPQRFLELPRKLEKLGEALVRLHQRRKYLDPFAVQTPQIFFSVDRLDNRDSLPKFNNFVDDRVEGFPDIRITIADDSTLAFYQIIANPRCPRCSTAIVSVSANTTQPILVEFPLREDSGWKFPECVRHSAEENEQWTVRGAVLTGLNATHAVCLFHLPGLYTIHLRADSGVLVRLSLGQSMVGPISALSSLVILLMSLLLTLSRRGLRTRPVRVAFILSFAAHAATIYLLHKATVNAVFCGVRNAVLSFTTVSPYCWLFLYSLHLYRMLAEGNTQTSAAVCLLLGMALPCCLSVVSFLLSATCSLAPSHWLFWTIALPIALFLLLSFYACATCLLISRDKHFEVAVVKFALRKALCQHFLLTSLTVTYTAGGLFLPSMPWLSAGLGEMVSSILLLLTSLYILVWACAFGRSEDQTDRVETLWVKGEPPKSMADEHGCTSPLLHEEYAGSRMGSGGSAAGWASGSDRVPSDPYVPLPRPVGGLSLRDNPLAPSILSPANKIFRETSEYATTGSLSRFGKYEDEMDDAYYTYQRRKQYPTTFQR